MLNKKFSIQILITLCLVISLILSVITLWKANPPLKGIIKEPHVDKDTASFVLISLQNGEIEVKKDFTEKDNPKLHLYTDALCGDCADFQKNVGEFILSKVREGKVELKIHPLNFLSQYSEDNYPLRSASLILSVAEEAPDRIPAFLNNLYNRDFKPNKEAPLKSDEDLLKLLEQSGVANPLSVLKKSESYKETVEKNSSEIREREDLIKHSPKGKMFVPFVYEDKAGSMALLGESKKFTRDIINPILQMLKETTWTLPISDLDYAHIYYDTASFVLKKGEGEEMEIAPQFSDDEKKVRLVLYTDPSTLSSVSLEEQLSDFLLKQITKGRVELEFHPIHFLKLKDEFGEEDLYALRASSILLSVAEKAPEKFWDFKNKLMSAEFLPDIEKPEKKEQDFLNLLKSVGIENGKEVLGKALTLEEIIMKTSKNFLENPILLEKAKDKTLFVPFLYESGEESEVLSPATQDFNRDYIEPIKNMVQKKAPVFTPCVEGEGCE